MSYYPQFPFYAAYPIAAFPNQEFYAMYPPVEPFFYDATGSMQQQVVPQLVQTAPSMVPFNSESQGKANLRKESTDSGVSDLSDNFASRKTSNISTISDCSIPEVDEEPLKVSEEKNGKEDSATPYQHPEDSLCEKIVVQVEFYFSDANITKDKFLLKHVKRNKEGFVSLKLISSFKRIKHLTKDWRQVAEAIERKSKKLEVNDLRTKVRRIDELPEYDETTPSRTVVALNLPMERPTIEAVAELFSICGDIVLIRILRPGNPIPADIKPFVNKHPEMTANVCALVEYEKTEFALKAVKELTEASSCDSPTAPAKLLVMELTSNPFRSAKHRDDKRKLSKVQANNRPLVRRFSHAGFENGTDVAGSISSGQPRRRVSLMNNMKLCTTINEEKELPPSRPINKDFTLNPNAPTFHSTHQRRFSRQEGISASLQASGCVPQCMSPQWMSRRFSTEMSTSSLALPPNVVRLPLGPEKGKGFHKWCKSRMENSGLLKNKGGHQLEKLKECTDEAKIIAEGISESIIESIITKSDENPQSNNDVHADDKAADVGNDSGHEDAFNSDQEPEVSIAAALDLKSDCNDDVDERSR